MVNFDSVEGDGSERSTLCGMINLVPGSKKNGCTKQIAVKTINVNKGQMKNPDTKKQVLTF